MKRTILAAKRLEAHRRLQTAVSRLAAAYGLPVPDLGQDAPVQDLAWLWRDEALADFLEALPENTGGFTAEEILAVDGLTATSKKALEAFFDGAA